MLLLSVHRRLPKNRVGRLTQDNGVGREDGKIWVQFLVR